ncbi:MAG: hypothetical protein RDU76_05870 [Candidatus Edwardsbacteria bacterium]|nr:hypothetical protein [Candidatus Edwardsbacteria bacterium]
MENDSSALGQSCRADNQTQVKRPLKKEAANHASKNKNPVIIGFPLMVFVLLSNFKPAGINSPGPIIQRSSDLI